MATAGIVANNNKAAEMPHASFISAPSLSMTTIFLGRCSPYFFRSSKPKSAQLDAASIKTLFVPSTLDLSSPRPARGERAAPFTRKPTGARSHLDPERRHVLVGDDP